MTFAELFPELRPWVLNLENVWPAYIIKPQFAFWQVWHILSLVVLGGCTILMNLRLLGVGITDEPPSEVRRNLWPYMHVGVVGVVISGVLIGMANAERLYDSAAFTVKMLALFSGIIFTYLVTGPVAKADGRMGALPKIAGVLSFVTFVLGLWIFTSRDLINPGMFHILTAASLIVAFVTRGRLRLIYLGVLALLAAGQFVLTHFVIGEYEFERLDPVNIGFAWAVGLWTLAIAALHLRSRGGEDAGAWVKASAYVSILIWVTAAAAGRWIAFA